MIGLKRFLIATSCFIAANSYSLTPTNNLEISDTLAFSIGLGAEMLSTELSLYGFIDDAGSSADYKFEVDGVDRSVVEDGSIASNIVSAATTNLNKVGYIGNASGWSMIPYISLGGRYQVTESVALRFGIEGSYIGSSKMNKFDLTGSQANKISKDNYSTSLIGFLPSDYQASFNQLYGQVKGLIPDAVSTAVTNALDPNRKVFKTDVLVKNGNIVEVYDKSSPSLPWGDSTWVVNPSTVDSPFANQQDIALTDKISAADHNTAVVNSFNSLISPRLRQFSTDLANKSNVPVANRGKLADSLFANNGDYAQLIVKTMVVSDVYDASYKDKDTEEGVKVAMQQAAGVLPAEPYIINHNYVIIGNADLSNKDIASTGGSTNYDSYPSRILYSIGKAIPGSDDVDKFNPSSVTQQNIKDGYITPSFIGATRLPGDRDVYKNYGVAVYEPTALGNKSITNRADPSVLMPLKYSFLGQGLSSIKTEDQDGPIVLIASARTGNLVADNDLNAVGTGAATGYSNLAIAAKTSLDLLPDNSNHAQAVQKYLGIAFNPIDRLNYMVGGKIILNSINKPNLGAGDGGIGFNSDPSKRTLYTSVYNGEVTPFTSSLAAGKTITLSGAMDAIPLPKAITVGKNTYTTYGDLRKSGIIMKIEDTAPSTTAELAQANFNFILSSPSKLRAWLGLGAVNKPIDPASFSDTGVFGQLEVVADPLSIERNISVTKSTVGTIKAYAGIDIFPFKHFGFRLNAKAGTDFDRFNYEVTTKTKPFNPEGYTSTLYVAKNAYAVNTDDLYQAASKAYDVVKGTLINKPGPVVDGDKLATFSNLFKPITEASLSDTNNVAAIYELNKVENPKFADDFVTLSQSSADNKSSDANASVTSTVNSSLVKVVPVASLGAGFVFKHGQMDLGLTLTGNYKFCDYKNSITLTAGKNNIKMLAAPTLSWGLDLAVNYYVC